MDNNCHYKTINDNKRGLQTGVVISTITMTITVTITITSTIHYCYV